MHPDFLRALDEQMDCNDPSGYIDGYPFPLSFDEQASKIVDWANKCRESADKR